MNHGIWIAFALLTVAPASAQDEARKDATGTKVAPTKPSQKKTAGGKKDHKPDAGGSAAWGGGGAAKSTAAQKKGTAAPKHAAERVALLRSRSTFRYALESCATDPKGCDTALRDDSEHRFMDACLACATRDQCEAERGQILAGSSKSSTTLCSD